LFVAFSFIPALGSRVLSLRRGESPSGGSVADGADPTGHPGGLLSRGLASPGAVRAEGAVASAAAAPRQGAATDDHTAHRWWGGGRSALGRSGRGLLRRLRPGAPGDEHRPLYVRFYAGLTGWTLRFPWVTVVLAL